MTTTALRPREIQNRIRSGESAEAVAETAGLTVEKLMPFAGPVLAERAHVAERAQRSTLRRAPGEAGTSRTLGDAVASHLRSLNLADDVVEWDAWRREDGRWTLVGAFETSGREGSARFSYDPRGNFVLAHDDDARWLIGEGSAAAAAAEAERAADDDLSAARRRRLSAVPEGETRSGGQVADLLAGEQVRRDADLGDDLGDDVIGMVHGDTEVDVEIDVVEVDVEVTSRHPEPTLDALLPLDDASLTAPEREASASDETDDTEETGEIARPKRASKRRGRTSVPSWDEIMFGGGDS